MFHNVEVGIQPRRFSLLGELEMFISVPRVCRTLEISGSLLQTVTLKLNIILACLGNHAAFYKRARDVLKDIAGWLSFNETKRTFSK